MFFLFCFNFFFNRQIFFRNIKNNPCIIKRSYIFFRLRDRIFIRYFKRKNFVSFCVFYSYSLYFKASAPLLCNRFFLINIFNSSCFFYFFYRFCFFLFYRFRCSCSFFFSTFSSSLTSSSEEIFLFPYDILIILYH